MSENLNSDQQQQLLFMMLLQQHEQIAMMGLGKIKNPVTDKVERDLNSAKYAIDTLVMLENFTKGNLSKELEGYLRQLLNNLRLNYADEKKKEPAKAQEKTSGNDKGASGAQKADQKGAAGDENAEKKGKSEDQKENKKENPAKDDGESNEKDS